ncbi:MAG: TetR family transcriptional regulator [Actinomycetota bacterium]|nr:MAG: TetR family transcriptional regulator [Actinomycetota bacterium]
MTRSRSAGTARRRPGPGRRPGASGTREAILAAARSRFAELGYEGATIRAIAADAGVDPALVHHYFGTKEQLFAAAVGFPFVPSEVLAGALRAEPERMGEAIARAVLAAWEDPATREAAMGLLRAAASNERAAAMLRGFVEASVIGPISRATHAPDATFRAALVASQMVGLALARYLVRVEPLASASPEELVRRVGPTLQRYLTA